MLAFATKLIKAKCFGVTNMQPMLKIAIMAILVRRFMRKSQINATGSNPIVRSVIAAPTLYTYATAVRGLLLMHEPWACGCMRFQK